MARSANSAKTATPNLASLIGAVPAQSPRQQATKSLTAAVDGLEIYGALNKVKKEIDEGFMETYGAPIKKEMLEYFVRNGLALGRCPPNYKGVDGNVTASLQLRRKDARSELKPEQVAMFNDLDIPVEHVIAAPHTYRVKPDVFAEQPELVHKMLEVLHKAGFAVGELFEEQHEQGKHIVAVNTIDKLFENAKAARASDTKSNTYNDKRIVELLECCAGLTIRADWNADFSDAFAITRALLDPTPAERAAQEKAAAEKEAAANAAAPKAKDSFMDALKQSLADTSDGVYSAPQAKRKAGKK